MTDWDDIRRQHGEVVWGTCYRILNHEADALDVYQEVFLEAISRRSETRISNWAGWLRWLATRRSIDALRRRRRQPASSDSFPQEPLDVGVGPEDAAMLDDLVRVIRSELRMLPDNQATAFWLGAVEQVSYNEVAEQMGISSGNVGVLVHRAREAIKHRLRERDLLPRESGDE